MSARSWACSGSPMPGAAIRTHDRSRAGGGFTSSTPARTGSAARAPGRLYEPRSYTLFAGLDMTLLALAGFLFGGQLGIAIGIGALLYLMALLMQNSGHARSQREQVTLALANEDLANLRA